AAWVTAARSVTLCARRPDSRTAACRRASCAEADGVVPAPPMPVLPERARTMTTPATTATSTAATITGISRRPGRRGGPEAGASSRSPSMAVGGSPDGTGPGPSTRVAYGSMGGCPPPGGAGHGCGPDGGGGGRRGAYQESQGAGSGCGGGAAAGEADGGNVAWGGPGAAGNGAVSGWDGA